MIPCPTHDYPINIVEQMEALEMDIDGIYVSSYMPEEEINKIRISEQADVYKMDFKSGVLVKYPKPTVLLCKEKK